MQRLRRLLLVVFGLVVLTVPLLPASTAAINVFKPCNNGSNGTSVTAGASDSTTCKDVSNQKSSGTNPFIVAIKDVIDLLSFIIGLTSIIMIIIGGIRIATAAGNTQAVSSARSGIVYALVGILVTVFAQLFVAFILNKIG